MFRKPFFFSFITLISKKYQNPDGKFQTKLQNHIIGKIREYPFQGYSYEVAKLLEVQDPNHCQKIKKRQPPDKCCR